MTFVILFLILFFIIIATFALGGILAAPWVPLKKKDVARMVRLAGLKDGELLVDLGCGDGRILIEAVCNIEAKAVGYEIAVLPYIVCRLRLLRGRLYKKAQVKYANFYNKNLSSANVVTAFLTPAAMKKLKKKLVSELRPRAKVVSYAFQIPDWKPVVVDKPSKEEVSIYVYQV